MLVWDKCRVVVHPRLLLFIIVTPLSQRVRAVISPLITSHRQLRVIVGHSLKWTTGGWQDIRQTAEVLDYSFTCAVKDRGHVESSSQLFTAMESQLTERQVLPQFFHGALAYSRHILAIFTDSVVWWLNCKVGERSRGICHNIRHE